MEGVGRSTLRADCMPLLWVMSVVLFYRNRAEEKGWDGGDLEDTVFSFKWAMPASTPTAFPGSERSAGWPVGLPEHA